MSNDEINLPATTSIGGKSRTGLRLSNRVSFSETINKSLPPHENDYEGVGGEGVGRVSSSSASARTISSSTSTLPPSSLLPLKRNTPILFSTNRGLHMRMTSLVVNQSSNINNNNTSNPASTKTSREGRAGPKNGSRAGSSMNRSRTLLTTPSTSINYTITFCDLERWSTNRANTVSLEDTFTIARPAVVPHSAASGSLASNSLRFLPQKTNSIRFKGYARFDIE
ncbi:uncharacterized protein LOC142237634 [Haematobia irritans]|uniref:uncharacterized protein LOC142237634 n=1 Tax=Haematobia irritans TaxID=7368 RepID=UPI003F4F4101